MSVLAVIPARYGSTRFPGKPLALLKNKPVIQHVYEQVKKAKSISEIIVATDDDRIVHAVKSFGGKAMLTNPKVQSGTERVAEVAGSRTTDVIINVQGDEPLIRGEQIDQVADFLIRHKDVPMASLMVPLTNKEDLNNPNVVKVVVDKDGYALYFSRSPIPFERTNGTMAVSSKLCYKHIGLYGYQRDFLMKFPSLKPTTLEQAEQLEQLRALEHGYRIKLLETAQDTVGIDTPEDLQRVEQYLKSNTQ